MLTASQTNPAAASQRSGAQSAGRAWWLAAWVAGVFALLMGVTLFTGHVGAKAEDPLKSPQLRALKEKLQLSPTASE